MRFEDIVKFKQCSTEPRECEPGAWVSWSSSKSLILPRLLAEHAPASGPRILFYRMPWTEVKKLHSHNLGVGAVIGNHILVYRGM
jgi:hypothetical protein